MMDRILSFDAKNESITIPAKALTDYGIKSIEDAPQLEMIVHQRWAIAVLRVKAIDIYGDICISEVLKSLEKAVIKDIEKRNENLEGYFINTLGGGV